MSFVSSHRDDLVRPGPDLGPVAAGYHNGFLMHGPGRGLLASEAGMMTRQPDRPHTLMSAHARRPPRAAYGAFSWSGGTCV